MSNFWNIVGFEFKKIVAKKSVIVTILLAVTLTIFSCAGLIIGNYYNNRGEFDETKLGAMQKDREYARALASRPIDSELLLETAKAYAKIPAIEGYMYTDEYELYGRSYSSIANLMRSVYGTDSKRFEFTDVQKLTQEQADAFYATRDEISVQSINARFLNQNSKDKLLLHEEQIETPFIFAYTYGYTHFFALMYTTGMIISIILAICLAPIFAGEYTARTDQLILSSKNGKKSLIFAKLFVGLSLAAIISILFTALTYFSCMLIYGSDGVHAPFQLLLPMRSYPLNMGQFALIFFISTLFASFLIAAITFLLSAKLKSSFGAIIIIFIFIIAPAFINVPLSNVFLYNLVNLMPVNMTSTWGLSSPLLYEVFGLSIEPYIFMPIFAALLSIVLLPFAFRGFKNHQIS